MCQFDKANDQGHSSAARGVGVIMGDNRLQAIAIRGTKDINIVRPVDLIELCSRMYKKIAESDGCGDWMVVEEDDSFQHNHFAWGKARTRRKDFWSEGLEGRWRKLKYGHVLAADKSKVQGGVAKRVNVQLVGI